MHLKKTAYPSCLGFTLIELLTVIGIVVILAAILLPVLASSRKRAGNTQCVSNLRQIGIAISLYRQDYDDHYPYAINSQDLANPANSTLAIFIDPALVSQVTPINMLSMPYIHSNLSWRCPLENEGYFDRYQSDYSYNEYLDQPFVPSMPINAFGNEPAKIPLVFDSTPRWHTDNLTTNLQADYVNVIYSDLHARRSDDYSVVLPL